MAGVRAWVTAAAARRTCAPSSIAARPSRWLMAPALAAMASAEAAMASVFSELISDSSFRSCPLALVRPCAIRPVRAAITSAEAQFSYAMGWWSRAAAQAMTLNGELMKAQAEALAPIHKTATANAKRLRKKS